MINWDSIDTVMLDMDGTLLDLHFDNYFWLDHLPQRYAQIHNVDLAAARDKLAEKSATTKVLCNGTAWSFGPTR